MTWGDICIAEKYLYVHQTMQRIQIPGMTGRKTKVVIQPPKSDCSIRKIPIPCEMMQILLPEQKGSNAFLLTGLERILLSLEAWKISSKQPRKAVRLRM